MFSATAYSVRSAAADDERALRRLAEVDSHDPLTTGPVLIGEIERMAADLRATGERLRRRQHDKARS